MTARVLAHLRGHATSKVDPKASHIASLTARERMVIALIMDGLPNKQIAVQLNISETTVRHHLTSIFEKLRVSSRLELVIYAFHHGLAKPH